MRWKLKRFFTDIFLKIWINRFGILFPITSENCTGPGSKLQWFEMMKRFIQKLGIAVLYIIYLEHWKLHIASLLLSRSCLPEDDINQLAWHHPFPGAVELGQRGGLGEARQLEAVQELPAVRTEEVDGPPLSLLRLGFGAAGDDNVSKRVPVGLHGKDR